MNTAPPVQLYQAGVTKPMTALVILGNHGALLTLSFLWQWQQTSDSLKENTNVSLRILRIECVSGLFCSVRQVLLRC